MGRSLEKLVAYVPEELGKEAEQIVEDSELPENEVKIKILRFGIEQYRAEEL